MYETPEARRKRLLLKSILISFFQSLFIYSLVIFIIFFHFKNKNSPQNISAHFSISENIETKSHYIAQFTSEKNLTLVFLSNIRSLEKGETSAFQLSGLTHLLAISGGQVSPITLLVSAFFARILYLLLRKRMQSFSLMSLIARVKGYINLIFSFHISIIFGFTGALLRVFSLSYLSQITGIKSIGLNIARYFIYTPYTLWIKVIILFLIAGIWGNPFNNYSFLLSTLGASIALLCQFMVQRILCAEKETAGFISSVFANKIFQYFLTLILSSLIINLALYPFLKSAIINCTLANIIAQPVVSLLITPLSLLCLFTPVDLHGLLILFAKMLDYSLLLFKEIALEFSDNDGNLLQSATLFSRQGNNYLIAIIVLSWSAVDLKNHLKILIAKVRLKDKI